MSSDWSCHTHGRVSPYFGGRPEGLEHVRGHARVPVWAPRPLHGWTLGGVGWCGDDRSGATATLLAMAGPSPVGGPADLVLVAEEPATGLGSRMAGIPDVDPGDLAVGAPEAKILAAGHPTPLWRSRSADDRVAFVGEALGVWLWAIVWPPPAELLLMEQIDLHDLRHASNGLADLPIGAPSPRLP